MLPILPYSSLTRPAAFVTQEWSRIFDPSNPAARNPASKVQGGWKGILYANLALIDPRQSWEFFAREDFDPGWIDGGASRTWYLAWAAGMFSPLFFPFLLPLSFFSPPFSLPLFSFFSKYLRCLRKVVGGSSDWDGGMSLGE